MNTLFDTDAEAEADRPRKLRDNGLSRDARAALVASAERQVRALARSMAAAAGRRFEQEEWEADAVLFAVEAAVEWDPTFGSAFPTYAYERARRSLLRRHQPAPLPAQIDAWEAQAGREDEDGAEAREPNEEAAALLRQLPEPTRSYVRLVRFEGLTPEAVADQFGESVKDVKLQLRNAHKQLAKLIDYQDRDGGASLFDQVEE